MFCFGLWLSLSFAVNPEWSGLALPTELQGNVLFCLWLSLGFAVNPDWSGLALPTEHRGMSYYCMSYGRNKGSRWSLPPTTNQTVKFRPFSIGDKSGWDLEKV